MKTGEVGPDRRGAGSPPPAAFHWSRFIAAESPADALEELSRRFGAETVELVLESNARGTGRLADWTVADPPTGERRRSRFDVSGEPPWSLVVTHVADGPDRATVDRACMALEAWREAQLELGRAESRLALRTQELDLIQSLGRRAASARTPHELFAATIEALQSEEDLDLALVAHAFDNRPETIAFVARPFSSTSLQALGNRAASLLGWKAATVPRPRIVCQEIYDEARGSREEVSEEDVVVLPILRGGEVTACLLFVVSASAREGNLRLLYSAANQLTLHLDRILTVREAEADRFRSILDSMPQAVVLTDTELRVVQTNRSTHRLFERLGLERQGNLRPAIERLGLLPEVEQVRRGEVLVVEREVAFDTDCVLSATLSPLAARPGSGAGLVLVLTDVTADRRLRQQLAQADKMSSLGEMISGVAHELNNPLASILGYTQLLRAKAKDDPSAQRFEVLQREAQRCRKIVENLLSFARSRAPVRTAFSLNEVVQSVLSLIGYALRVENIEVVTNLDASLPALRGDAHQIQQVLVNLLTNALHALRDFREDGQVVLTTSREEGDRVRLEVRDNGPGIPEEMRGKIFDPFFTTKAEGAGTGLGLSLVYGIVDSHGGTIEVAQPAEGGTLFLIRIPVVRGETPVARPTDESLHEPPSRPGRILVVDDEPAVTRMICDALQEDGHRTCSSADGSEALRELERESFDLIVSDIKMPGMGGERLFEEIGLRHPRMAGRILLTTGDTVGLEPQRIAERTGLEVIHKPFDLALLRRSVRSRLVDDGES